MLQLSAEDQKISAFELSVESLSLYFCWRCQLAQGLFVYRISPHGNVIEILKYRQGPQSFEFPYRNYPIEFPAVPCRLISIDEDTQAQIESINDGRVHDTSDCFGLLDIPRHQIGGIPYLLQGKDDPQLRQACVGCGELSPLVAAVGDSTFGELSFTGNPFVQILYFFCRTCRIVSCYQQTD